MALSNPSVLGTPTASSSGSTTVVTPTISPSSDAVLVGIISATRATGAITLPGSPMSTTLSNVGSWTIYGPVAQLIGTTDSVDKLGQIIFLAVAEITGAPGSGTITATFNETVQNRHFIPLEVTGHRVGSPVRQSKTATGTGSGLTVTLDSTPLGDSLIIGGIVDSQIAVLSSNPTPGTGFSELSQQATSIIPVSNRYSSTTQAQYDKDSADTTCDWTGLVSVLNGAIAIEIQAPATNAPRAYHHRRIIGVV